MKAYPTSVTTARQDSFIGRHTRRRIVARGRPSIYDGARDRDRTRHSGSERIMQLRAAGTRSAEPADPVAG